MRAISNYQSRLSCTTEPCPSRQGARSYHLTPETCGPRTQKLKLRSLQTDLLHSSTDLLFCRLRRRPIRSLFRSFDTLICSTSDLLRLLTLLLRLLSRSLIRLLFFGLACLLTTERLAPLLLLLWLDLTEEVPGDADLVTDREGSGFPCVWDDEELGIKL
jgi:hypothetical protein